MGLRTLHLQPKQDPEREAQVVDERWWIIILMMFQVPYFDSATGCSQAQHFDRFCQWSKSEIRFPSCRWDMARSQVWYVFVHWTLGILRQSIYNLWSSTPLQWVINFDNLCHCNGYFVMIIYPYTVYENFVSIKWTYVMGDRVAMELQIRYCEQQGKQTMTIFEWDANAMTCHDMPWPIPSINHRENMKISQISCGHWAMRLGGFRLGSGLAKLAGWVGSPGTSWLWGTDGKASNP